MSRKSRRREASRRAVEKPREVSPSGGEVHEVASQLSTGEASTDAAASSIPWGKHLAKLQDDINALVSTMPPRMAKFARLYAGGATQSQAAIDAGYARGNAAQQGCDLAADPRVRQLAELIQSFDIQTEQAITRAALRAVLVDTMTNGKHTAKVAAVRAAIRLEGYGVTRVEVTGAVSTLNAEDLRKQLADRFARQNDEKE